MQTGRTKALSVCYFGTYRRQYGRNQILMAGLRSQGVQVTECHATLWHGIEDRVQQVQGGFLRPALWRRLIAAYWRLIRQHRRTPAYDVMIIGYPGPFDAFLGRLLSFVRRKPLILDHYMSLYLIALERGLVTPTSLKGRLLRFVEGLGLRLPDLLLSDTAEYIAYHSQTYGLRPERFSLVPAGADERLYSPRPELQPPPDCFRVTYYGTFIPNHGVGTMIRAANLLQDHKEILFEFYGEGPELAAAQAAAAEAGLSNVRFHGWLAKEALPAMMAQSQLCLGVFGQTPQSLMTVQNKIWEAAAMARPMISGDSPTMRNTFTHGKELYLVDRADPQALADGILALQADAGLRERMARAARERFLAGNSMAALGARLCEAIDDLRRDA